MNTQQSDPFGHFSKPQKPQPERRVTNFLEAFKENAQPKRPSNFLEAIQANADKQRPSSLAEAMARSSSSHAESQISVTDSGEYEEAMEAERQKSEQERMLAHQHEEELRARFAAREEQVKKEIEVIRDAILKIAKSLGAVGLEFEKAAFQAPKAPGRYHVGFFTKLKEALEFVKKRIDDSASWLHTMNGRSKKQEPYFWQQVAVSGTKYQFSSERYMQMSAG